MGNATFKPLLWPYMVGQSVGHAFTLSMRMAFNVPARVALQTRRSELPSKRLIASKNVQWMPSSASILNSVAAT